MTEEGKIAEKQAEKPLDKMTVLELRALAKEEIPDLTGVTGMKKEQLLEALKDARGVRDDAQPRKKQKKKSPGPKKEMTVPEMKQEITRLRVERESLSSEKDKKKLAIIRRRINRLKKKTRRAA